MDKTYHYVQVTKEGGSNLLSSDLFINDLEGAKNFFIEKIKECDPSIDGSDEGIINDALDEGYYTVGNTVVMYVEPHNIFGKE